MLRFSSETRIRGFQMSLADDKSKPRSVSSHSARGYEMPHHRTLDCSSSAGQQQPVGFMRNVFAVKPPPPAQVVPINCLGVVTSCSCLFKCHAPSGCCGRGTSRLTWSGCSYLHVPLVRCVSFLLAL